MAPNFREPRWFEVTGNNPLHPINGTGGSNTLLSASELNANSVVEVLGYFCSAYTGAVGTADNLQIHNSDETLFLRCGLVVNAAATGALTGVPAYSFPQPLLLRNGLSARTLASNGTFQLFYRIIEL